MLVLSGSDDGGQEEVGRHVSDTEQISITDKRGQNRSGETVRNEPPPRQSVATAFVVMLDHAGAVSATSDMAVLEQISITRAASIHDMFNAAVQLHKDIEGQEIATRVLGALEQQARAAQQQMLAHQMMSNGSH